MIYTSYFGNLKNLPKNITPISICAKVPEWYKGLQYKKLAPKYQTLMTWKADHDDEKYIESYTRTVLNQLVSDNVITELRAVLRHVEGHEHNDIALICYEKPSDFCHRHLVAQWLRDNGFGCSEYRRG